MSTTTSDVVRIDATRADIVDPIRADAELRFEVTPDRGLEMTVRWGYPEARDRGTYQISRQEVFALLDLVELLTD